MFKLICGFNPNSKFSILFDALFHCEQFCVTNSPYIWEKKISYILNFTTVIHKSEKRIVNNLFHSKERFPIMYKIKTSEFLKLNKQFALYGVILFRLINFWVYINPNRMRDLYLHVVVNNVIIVPYVHQLDKLLLLFYVIGVIKTRFEWQCGLIYKDTWNKLKNFMWKFI